MNKFFKFKKLAVFCFVVLAGVLLFSHAAYAIDVLDVRGGIMGVLTDWFISFGEFCIK